MSSTLSLQQAPPLSVPARFFLTAPLFGIAAALMLLVSGDTLLVSRWSPSLLAATHCLVLGCISTVMLGALQQLLPVLAGGIISRPRLIAGLVHVPWVAGIALLTWAFLRGPPLLFHVAATLLAIALLIFTGAVLRCLHRAKSASDSAAGMRLAIAALLVTLLLGVLLALGLAGVLPLWRPRLTNLHLSWGLAGWIGTLIAAVAWQVVPMFQITPAYPRWFRLPAARFVLALLIVKSLLTWPLAGALGDRIIAALDLLIAAGMAGFAIATLHLQQRARRKVRDSHRDFWRLGMTHLVLAAGVWCLAEASGNPLWDVLAGVLFVCGFAMAVVTGMLLKVVAFLIWLHLQGLRDALVQSGKGDFSVPKMKAVIPSRSGDRILLLLFASQLAIIGAVLAPRFLATPAALLWLALFAYLGTVLGYALYRYRRIRLMVHRAA